ncbi:MAG TPA: hypothetical protein PLQ88_25085, partial [Blastocatellia bacterium]|nr:hypothetical protein [Blastocatellia bacterium]
MTLTVIALAVTFSVIQPQRAAETAGNQHSERAAQIEAALFARAEFFGAQAIVPYPTAEARTRLAEVARRFPADGEIQWKLAELDEKLGNADAAQQAMLRYVELEKNSVAALRRLAEFYDRRARFGDEA